MAKSSIHQWCSACSEGSAPLTAKGAEAHSFLSRVVATPGAALGWRIWAMLASAETNAAFQGGQSLRAIK